MYTLACCPWSDIYTSISLYMIYTPKNARKTMQQQHNTRPKAFTFKEKVCLGWDSNPQPPRSWQMLLHVHMYAHKNGSYMCMDKCTQMEVNICRSKCCTFDKWLTSGLRAVIVQEVVFYWYSHIHVHVRICTYIDMYVHVHVHKHGNCNCEHQQSSTTSKAEKNELPHMWLESMTDVF